VNKKTAVISRQAWTMAGTAAFAMTAKLMEAPSRTRPVLIRNSVRKALDIFFRRPSADKIALAAKPTRIA